MAKSIYSQRHGRLCSLLRAARKERDKTQAELAAALGRNQSFVAKYESGERRLDVIEFLEVAIALEIDFGAMLTAVLGERPDMSNQRRVKAPKRKT